MPVGTLCGYALQGTQMDNLLNLEHLIGLDTEQAKRWTYADRFLPHSVFCEA